jgi:hypothetical protein
MGTYHTMTKPKEALIELQKEKKLIMKNLDENSSHEIDCKSDL